MGGSVSSTQLHPRVDGRGAVAGDRVQRTVRDADSDVVSYRDTDGDNIRFEISDGSCRNM